MCSEKSNVCLKENQVFIPHCFTFTVSFLIDVCLILSINSKSQKTSYVQFASQVISGYVDICIGKQNNNTEEDVLILWQCMHLRRSALI